MVSSFHNMQGHRSLLSPLRYPGSKRRLVGYIRTALELNALRPSLYIEPFAGGASVALQLMEDDLVEKVILVDRDPWIASFWHTVFFDTAWLVNQIESIDVTLANWRYYKSTELSDTKEQALAALFLNRTSFSGILQQGAGPLGGWKQESEYKIDCRFPRQTLIQRVEQAAKHRDKIVSIWDCSWDEAVVQIRDAQRNGELPNGSVFYYLDPPFFEKADALYRYVFAHEDHVALRDALMELEDSWMLSYDSADQVESLYGHAVKKRTNGAQKHHVEVPYSVAVMSKRPKVAEVIITNLPKLPESPNLCGDGG